MQSGVSAHRVVSQRRSKRYVARDHAHVVIDPNKKVKKGKRKRSPDPGGKGWEIQSEMMVCADYASALQAEA